jgi:hypothetical protein
MTLYTARVSAYEVTKLLAEGQKSQTVEKSTL